MVGGYTTSPAAYRALTESWNGSSWTEVGDLNDGRAYLSGAITDTSSAIVFGGDSPGSVAVTEVYDGTSWTELADLATARNALMGAGTTTAALATGGNIPPYSTATEEWTVVPVNKTITTS